MKEKKCQNKSGNESIREKKKHLRKKKKSVVREGKEE